MYSKILSASGFIPGRQITYNQTSQFCSDRNAQVKNMFFCFPFTQNQIRNCNQYQQRCEIACTAQ